MNDKRFYWIKLKTNFFEQDAIDFLLSQPNGSDYIALYLKLCTMTANTNGQLATQIGEILIPYDAQKIARDTKYFSVDTVIVAMELFKKLGLIYESSDNVLQIADYENMVGSSKNDEYTKKLNAERQRKSRANRKQKLLESNVTVTDTVTLPCHTEIRDKSIEIRDKDKDICFDLSKPTKHKFGEYHHVLLTEDEYERLKNLYGGYKQVEEHIKILDEYIETSGKKYKNHCLVIQRWVHERYLKEHKNNENVQLDSKFYAQESNQTQEEINKEMERVRREILGNVA
jgi:predicted phage replisome organizer